MPTADPTQLQMQRTMEFMPLMFLFFSFQVASGLVLYWVISNVYSIAQQRFTTGWGTLPWLGSKGAPPADPKSPSPKSPSPKSPSTGAKAPAPRQRRRSAAGGSARRKRGK
jgi:YidC/Oxa1 family membrane protein insertase